MRNFSIRELLPILLLIGFGVFLSAPFLFFGKAFAGEEHMGFYYAISFWVHESITHGTPMLWQSAYYGGVSSSLDQFVGAWYPVNIFLFSYFPFFIAHHLSIFFATTLGLCLSYWFGRTQGWGKATAIVFALSYLSATTFAWLAIGTTAAHSFMMLPGLMLSLWYVANRSNSKIIYAFFVLWGGIALGVGFLAGFMQIVFYNFCIAGAYALFLDWKRWLRGSGVIKSIKVSLSYVCMTFVGLLFGIWQFFPSAYLIGLTIRTSDYALQNITHVSIFEMVAFFLPPYGEIPFLVAGGGSAGMYVGAIGLLFACIGLIHYRSRELLFFSGLYVLICAFAFHLPLFGWINDHLPPFSHMGGNFRWMTVGAFPLAYVAAAGMHGFLTNPLAVSKHSKRVYVWALSIVTCLLIIGSAFLSLLVHYVLRSPSAVATIIGWYGRVHSLSAPMAKYSAVLISSLEKASTLFSLTSPHYLFAIFTWLLALGFLLVYLRVWRMREYAPYVLVTCMVLTVGGTFAFQWSGLTSQDLFKEQPKLISVISARENDPHSYRIMGFITGDGLYEKLLSKPILTPDENTRLQLQMLTDNSNIYWGIERIDGLEPYRTLRSNQLLNTVIAYDTAAYVFDDEKFFPTLPPLTKLYNREVQKSVTLEQKLEDLKMHLPLLSMMNVKYLYTLYPISDSHLVQVSELNVQAGTTQLPLYLYENTMVLPRIYFAKNELFASGSDSEILRHVLSVKDFSENTVIECSTCSPVATEGSITVDRYDPGNVQVTTHSSKGGYVVLSESALPGWQARIDGTETHIYTANYLFQAVYVEPGTHTISFVYRDITMVQLGALFSRLP